MLLRKEPWNQLGLQTGRIQRTQPQVKRSIKAHLSFQVHTLEVSSLGFVSSASLNKFLRLVGAPPLQVKEIRRLGEMALRCSFFLFCCRHKPWPSDITDPFFHYPPPLYSLHVHKHFDILCVLNNILSLSLYYDIYCIASNKQLIHDTFHIVSGVNDLYYVSLALSSFIAALYITVNQYLCNHIISLMQIDLPNKRCFLYIYIYKNIYNDSN